MGKLMFTGSIVALVTPMHSEGAAIDWQSYDRLLQFHLDNGTDGFVIGGTTGESPVITTEEHIRLVARAKELVKSRVPVIAGSGSNSTARTIELSQALQQAGADGLLVVTPYYNKPPQEGLVRHFTAIADAVRIPVVLYNVPGRTAVDLLPDTVIQLSFHERIVAIKEASGIVDRSTQILAGARAGFVTLSGDDLTYVQLMQAGARGTISVTANVAPRKLHDICAAALAGDFAKAQSLDATLQTLHKTLFIEANPIPLKWMLARMGLMEDGIRLPLVPLHQRFHGVAMKALASIGVRFA
jgi:4-hydroxy-tetrahydrodipicolinate synthase